MTLLNALLLLLGVLSNAGASVLIKLASAPGAGLQALLTRPLLYAGLTLYGAAFVLYALVLQRLPLGVAQPLLTGGALITVTLLSATLLHEHLGALRLAGVALVLLGALLLTIPAR